MMSKPVIKVEQVSKRYRIGAREQADTISQQIKYIVSSPLRNLRNIKRLNTFSKEENEDTIYWALRDISFEVKQGEVLGIIGHNGAGKSTLLKILSKITEPTTGKIEIRGRVSSLLEVGTGFHPELTGRDNVFMNGTILGMSAKEVRKKFDQIVDFAGVDKYIDTPIKFYSSGMKVRLGFSVAAHLDPEILIVDEVLAVGDFEFQKKCLGKMDEVSQSGRTVLFVSHDMGAIKNLCHRGVLLSKGKKLLEGTHLEAIQAYLNNSEVHETNLLSRQDRIGDQSILISDFFVTNNLSTNTHCQVLCGEDTYFVFKLDKRVTHKISMVSLIVVIKDVFGSPVTTLHTRFKNTYFEIDTSQQNFYCLVPKLPLAEGQYYLTLRVLAKSFAGQTGGELCDHLENAKKLDILPGDYFGNGRAPNPLKHGNLLMQQTWKSYDQ